MVAGAILGLLPLLFAARIAHADGETQATAAPSAAMSRIDVVGQIAAYTVQQGETLMDIARRFDMGVPELRAANPTVDPWLPGVGREITLPMANVLPDAARDGIVINLAELRLYHFTREGVYSHAIGVGRDGFMTPLGSTKVVRKREKPTWYPTAATRADRPELPRAVPAGPDNPLGEYAISLGWPTYLIHGTTLPGGVGRRVSRGCIRMYPEGIEALFGRVPYGTPVHVVNQPLKLGWLAGELYIEVHPNIDQIDEVEARGRVESMSLDKARDAILAAAGENVWRVDWDNVEAALNERSGMPVRIVARQ